MSVTNQPPSPAADQGKVDDYHVMEHVGEFTRTAASHAGTALNVVLLVLVGILSLALFWVVATMIGVI
jgi:hypothetical protein